MIHNLNITTKLIHTPSLNYSDSVFKDEKVELLRKGIQLNPVIINYNSYQIININQLKLA